MRSILVWAFVLLTGTVFSQHSENKLFDSLTAAYETNGYHGVVLVAKGDRILYEKGYGLADFDKKIKHRPETEFKTESVGKMFTAVSIMQLLEKKKLRLDQTVRELLPWLEIKNADKITVHHLLSHTSGLQSPWDHPEWRFKNNYTKEQMIRFITGVPLVFDTPGKTMYYSNSGYIILGWIIEAVSGQPFDSYFQQHIFSVCGMKKTRHLNDTVMPAKNGAQPYRLLGTKKYILMDETLGPKSSAAGGWLSTAHDLYLFLNALHKGKLISRESWEIMRTANHHNPKDSSYRYYAYGLETYINQLIPGAELYGHNGGGAGFSIDAFLESRTGYMVVMCTNLYQNTRPITMNYFKAAMNRSADPVGPQPLLKLFDLIEEKGMDYFLSNEKKVFADLRLNMHPGLFLQMSDALDAAHEKEKRLQWMNLARTYYPKEAYLFMISGDIYQQYGNRPEAEKMYHAAKDLAGAQQNERLIKELDKKLSIQR